MLYSTIPLKDGRAAKLLFFSRWPFFSALLIRLNHKLNELNEEIGKHLIKINIINYALQNYQIRNFLYKQI